MKDSIFLVLGLILLSAVPAAAATDCTNFNPEMIAALKKLTGMTGDLGYSIADLSADFEHQAPDATFCAHLKNVRVNASAVFSFAATEQDPLAMHLPADGNLPDLAGSVDYLANDMVKKATFCAKRFHAKRKPADGSAPRAEVMRTVTAMQDQNERLGDYAGYLLKVAEAQSEDCSK